MQDMTMKLRDGLPETVDARCKIVLVGVMFGAELLIIVRDFSDLVFEQLVDFFRLLLVKHLGLFPQVP